MNCFIKHSPRFAQALTLKGYREPRKKSLNLNLFQDLLREIRW